MKDRWLISCTNSGIFISQIITLMQNMFILSRAIEKVVITIDKECYARFCFVNSSRKIL